jgi:enamine deaminase RidA (YjgF/YER057c/UK114 family)
MTATKRPINPWTWQDEYGFVQANEVTGARGLLVCSGQISVDADGAPVHPGDLQAQLHQALDNLETVLRHAGLALSDVVRLNVFTTDVDGMSDAWDKLVARLTTGKCRPTMTVLGVNRLAFPELLLEIEATAAVG